eukprot:scaffold70745_cov49-Phaeocystis_antarctica.AAC.2
MRGTERCGRRATEKSNVVLASVVPLSRRRRARARAPSRRHTAACIEATLLEGRPHHAESYNLLKAPPRGPDSKFQEARPLVEEALQPPEGAGQSRRSYSSLHGGARGVRVAPRHGTRGDVQFGREPGQRATHGRPAGGGRGAGRKARRVRGAGERDVREKVYICSRSGGGWAGTGMGMGMARGHTWERADKKGRALGERARGSEVTEAEQGGVWAGGRARL